jgi:DNA topoisomerase-1
MSRLMIVESPAKAKKIGGYLGEGWQVIASAGHLCDLPAKELGVDVNAQFTPSYAVLPGKNKLVMRIKKAAQAAEAVYIATDPDREGEAIGWHALRLAKLPKDKPVYRVTFNAITADAVRRAVAAPRPMDTHLVEAQQTRRIVDRLVGYLASPLACKALDGQYSAGRVQSASLRLIVERERAITAFVPEDYQKLAVRLRVVTGEFVAKLHRIQGADTRFKDPEQLNKVVQVLQGATFTITDVKHAEQVKNPAPPFTTSTLQQAAAKALGLSPDRVMELAQLLYEQGQITYHRTDGVAVAPEAQAAARAYIDATYGTACLPSETPTFHAKSANAQEAHEAIRPTDLTTLSEALTGDAASLYRLIRDRFIASQMAAARYAAVTITVLVSKDEKQYPLEFRAKGRNLVFDGFLRVYQEVEEEPAEDDDEHTLPEVHPKEIAALVEPLITQHQTQAPGRFSEAGLIAELERVGIGRPSTYAATVKQLKEKGYVKLSKKRLVPTETGEKLLDYLLAHFDTVFEPTYTATLEEDLDSIARGEKTRLQMLQTFWLAFQPHLTNASQQAAAHLAERFKNRPQPKPIGEPCPQCNSDLVERQGSRGMFIGCSAFPKCTYTRGAESQAVVLHAQ